MMKGKAMVVFAVFAAVLVASAGVAVAALSSRAADGTGCARGTPGSGVLSRTKAGEAQGLKTAAQGEEDRIRAECCHQEADGEGRGECECLRERVREREEDGHCSGCPQSEGEAFRCRSGACGEAGGPLEGCGLCGTNGSGTGGGGGNRCEADRDRLRTRDQDRLRTRDRVFSS